MSEAISAIFEKHRQLARLVWIEELSRQARGKMEMENCVGWPLACSEARNENDKKNKAIRQKNDIPGAVSCT